MRKIIIIFGVILSLILLMTGCISPNTKSPSFVDVTSAQNLPINVSFSNSVQNYLQNTGVPYNFTVKYTDDKKIEISYYYTGDWGGSIGTYIGPEWTYLRTTAGTLNVLTRHYPNDIKSITIYGKKAVMNSQGNYDYPTILSVRISMNKAQTVNWGNAIKNGNEKEIGDILQSNSDYYKGDL